MLPKPKIIIGFITYGKSTAKYLPAFLDSLQSQTFKDFTALAFDNTEGEENANIDYIKENFPIIEIDKGDKNIGFAAAFNLLIEKSRGLGAQYFLAANPDTFFEPNVLADMLKVMDDNPELGSVSPKIYKWDFENNQKTKIIDTCGIKLQSGLRFIDLGQGESDNGQYDDSAILGPSGAAALYRIEALEKIKRNGQYFDELMFMYKEDCDIAYRLHLAGFGSKCASQAIVHHDRSTGLVGGGLLGTIIGRTNKNYQIKKWSFLNQQIIYKKYWRQQSWISKFLIISRKIQTIVYALFFEPYLLEELNNLRKLKNKIQIY